MRAPRITKEQRYARIVQLRSQGLTYRVIAQRVGCTMDAISRALKAAQERAA